MYRGHQPAADSGTWCIDFGGLQLLVPLDGARMWLDWDTAVSIYGHDLEVKNTYLNFLQARSVPDLFVDAGANYGTHSLIFRKNEIPTISFEPNPECKEQFCRLCRANGVDESLEEAALGSQEKDVHLAYDSSDTWCGKIVNDATSSEKSGAVTKVKQRTLDNYINAQQYRRILVKIDVEGHEIEVLKGLERILGQKNAFVIFESNIESKQRPELHKFLGERDYDIFLLPFNPERPKEALSLRQFELSRDSNFIAAPCTSLSRSV
jgi:FkbM family methyltransferase